MRRLWALMFGRECQHSETIVVRTVGVERTICEACGHISFTMSSMYPHLAQVEEPPLDKASSF